MEYTISGTNVVALAVAVRFLGTFINKKVAYSVFPPTPWDQGLEQHDQGAGQSQEHIRKSISSGIAECRH